MARTVFDAEALSESAQFEVAHLISEESSRQGEGVDNGWSEVINTRSFERRFDEPKIKRRIMGNEDCITNELPEAHDDLLNSWGWCEHGISQSGDNCDLWGKSDTRIDEGVKGANRFACLHLDCTDLANEVAL